jgi:hypothetical protein
VFGRGSPKPRSPIEAAAGAFRQRKMTALSIFAFLNFLIPTKLCNRLWIIIFIINVLTRTPQGLEIDWTDATLLHFFASQHILRRKSGQSGIVLLRNQH